MYSSELCGWYGMSDSIFFKAAPQSITETNAISNAIIRFMEIALRLLRARLRRLNLLEGEKPRGYGNVVYDYLKIVSPGGFYYEVLNEENKFGSVERGVKGNFPGEFADSVAVRRLQPYFKILLAVAVCH